MPRTRTSCWRPTISVRCRRCGHHGLVGGPAGRGSTAPSPCGPGSGAAPPLPRPAADPASRRHHGPLPAGRCRPSSSPCPATTAPAPPPAARCRAPGTAGRRGCRTAGRGCGTLGSEDRSSAGYTDGVVRLRPAAALAALVEPRSGREADLPGPSRRPAAHRCHRPWPDCRAPTNPEGCANAFMQLVGTREGDRRAGRVGAQRLGHRRPGWSAGPSDLAVAASAPGGDGGRCNAGHRREGPAPGGLG
jgi:hypothetical protein